MLFEVKVWLSFFFFCVWIFRQIELGRVDGSGWGRLFKRLCLKIQDLLWSSDAFWILLGLRYSSPRQM